MDTNGPVIVSITDFRRNAGSYIDQSVPLTVVRGSQVVGQFIPATKRKISAKDGLKKLEQIAGGSKLGIKLTPEQLNKDYNKMYDKMLPR